jgi:hypothetical protein
MSLFLENNPTRSYLLHNFWNIHQSKLLDDNFPSLKGLISRKTCRFEQAYSLWHQVDIGTTFDQAYTITTIDLSGLWTGSTSKAEKISKRIVKINPDVLSESWILWPERLSSCCWLRCFVLITKVKRCVLRSFFTSLIEFRCRAPWDQYQKGRSIWLAHWENLHAGPAL